MDNIYKGAVEYERSKLYLGMVIFIIEIFIQQVL